MKTVEECIGDIGRSGSTIFSTLDLSSGFWQLPLEKNSQKFTAFTVHNMGQFEWTRTSQGLHSAPGQYQRLMELTVKGLHNVIVYIDDLLVHDSEYVFHRKSLQSLFDQLRKANLKLNLTKCNFGSTNVTYLGFRLTPEGILPGSDKLAAVKNATPPKKVHQIRQFLGLANFFRTHIRNFALISSLLNVLTRKDSHWKGGPFPPLLYVLLTNSVLLSVLNLWSIIRARIALMPSLSMLPLAAWATRAGSAACCARPMITANFMSLLMLAVLSQNTRKTILHFWPK
jgi:hypothetical protein